jgi:hypothetical protein
MAYIIKATPSTTEQLKGLVKYMEDTSIPYVGIPAAPSETSPIALNPIVHLDRPNVLFKPTAEFKHFVGSERLTKHRYVSYQDILERTYIYTKTNKLLTSNQRGFYLDSFLATLLKTTSPEIEWADLYNHISMLIPIVS